MGAGAAKELKEEPRDATKLGYSSGLANRGRDPEKRRTSLFNFIQRQRDANSSMLPQNLGRTFRRLRRLSSMANDYTVANSDEYLKDRLSQSYAELTKTDERCHFCDKYAGFGGYSCRVCSRNFHFDCVKARHDVREVVKDTIHNARTKTGWSCHICDDVSLLLTTKEMKDLLKSFRINNIKKDATVNLDDYLRYRQNMSSTGMDEIDTNEEKTRFDNMDTKANGTVDWQEFLNEESIRVLAKRPKENLVRTLDGKELEKCRRAFRMFDENGDGCISYTEAQRAYLRLRRARATSSKVMDDVIDQHFGDDLSAMAQDASLANISIEEFVKSQAICCIAGRPDRAVVD